MVFPVVVALETEARGGREEGWKWLVCGRSLLPLLCSSSPELVTAVGDEGWFAAGRGGGVLRCCARRELLQELSRREREHDGLVFRERKLEKPRERERARH